MRQVKLNKSTITKSILGITTVAFLTSIVIGFAATSAHATPKLAKGKPCGSCHTGSPPSKSNAPR
jgi:hypothetical protein